MVRIDETAIENITQLTHVGRTNAPSSISNNSDSSNLPNALEEPRRRFPTADSSRSREVETQPETLLDTGVQDLHPLRSALYPSRRAAGRPLESLTVSRDVVITEYRHDRVPSKTEQAQLENSKRVISVRIRSQQRLDS